MLRFGPLSKAAIVLTRLYILKSPLQIGKWHLQQAVTFLNVKNKSILRAKMKEGFDMELDVYEQVQRDMYYWGEWQKKDSDAFKKILRQGDVFIDVGANVGYFSLLASKLVGKEGKVYAFEPSDDNYSRLKKNKQINKYDNIQIEKIALSDKSGKVKLYRAEEKFNPLKWNMPNNNQGANSLILENAIYDRRLTLDQRKKLKKDGAFTYESVAALTFDEYINKKNASPEKITLVKIDVEGAEYRVLKGMEKSLHKYKPVVGLEMIEDLLVKGGTSIKQIQSFMKKLGYDAYIEKNNAIKKTEKIGAWTDVCFFIHKDSQKLLKARKVIA